MRVTPHATPRGGPAAPAPTPPPGALGYPGAPRDRAGAVSRPDPHPRPDVSKKTKKRKLKARRNKANHGRKPNAGR
jgi:hypothetical protein